MKNLILLATLVLLSLHAKADLMKDFDSLGGNDVLLEKAKKLNPDTTINVVQDRIVARRNRFELAPEFSSVLGGDAYTRTNNLGLNVHFHITPHWSVGAKYNYSFNELRPEGQNLIDEAVKRRDVVVDRPGYPDIDYAKDEFLGLVNWYPIYGKMNLYDLGVLHFDVYALGGYGKINLRSGPTNTWTTGGGMGLWFSQHLTSRLEMRYQSYTGQRYDGAVQMNTTIASVQVGYLL